MLYILDFLGILERPSAGVEIAQMVGEAFHHVRQLAEERNKSDGKLFIETELALFDWFGVGIHTSTTSLSAPCTSEEIPNPLASPIMVDSEPNP